MAPHEVAKLPGESTVKQQVPGMATRFSTSSRQLAAAVREYVLLDFPPYRWIVSLGGLGVGLMLLVIRRSGIALRVLTAVHRAAYLRASDTIVEHLLRSAFQDADFARPLRQACRAYIDHQDHSQNVPVAADPNRLLGPLAMVLRSPSDDHKGVIVLQYNYVFPIFAHLFDVAAIAERYHIVLEPSWSGFCTPDVLCYAGLAPNVFVQAFEPRDRRFVATLGCGFVPVPTSTNWWVDHRVFRPVSAVHKDADVIMVAAWGPYKRHGMFFRALRTVRKSRPDLRVILVGYPLGLTKDEILALAASYGVEEMIECLENLTQAEVNVQLNRAKVNVLWSRKEGVNRAIIEGMFANVPCIVRDGFNYGHRYEYINAATGAFSTETDLPSTLIRMLNRWETYQPRQWVMEHMSCQRSTEILRKVVDGGRDSPPLAVKVNGLHGMHYWTPEDAGRFDSDYRYLSDVARRRHP